MKFLITNNTNTSFLPCPILGTELDLLAFKCVGFLLSQVRKMGIPVIAAWKGAKSPQADLQFP